MVSAGQCAMCVCLPSRACCGASLLEYLLTYYSASIHNDSGHKAVKKSCEICWHMVPSGLYDAQGCC